MTNTVAAYKAIYKALSQNHTFAADIAYAKRIASDAGLNDIYAALDLQDINWARSVAWTRGYNAY